MQSLLKKNEIIYDWAQYLENEVWGLRTISTQTKVGLTEFVYANADTNIQLLAGWFYFISCS